jgi:hypothetical protein
MPNSNGEGELLEIKVTTKVRTPLGVMHDTTQSFVLNGEDANDTLASLRVIHNNLQLSLMKMQQQQEAQDVEKNKTDNGAELSINKVAGE